MELLLNYFDAKMNLLAQDIKANNPAPGNYMTEWRNQARESRHKLLASFDPSAEEPKEPLAYWQFKIPFIISNLGRPVFKSAEDFARLPEVHEVLETLQDLPTGNMLVRYHGLRVEGAEPWYR